MPPVAFAEPIKVATIQLWIHNARNVLLQILLRNLASPPCRERILNSCCDKSFQTSIAGINGSGHSLQQEDSDVS
ncbi:MAG UNVERIFIED_CONTAM: hypothetical protein LVR18_52415 [Planctomycetaceae bacterium]